MDSDSGRPAHEQKAPDLWRVPKIWELHIRARRFDPAKRVTTAGVDRRVQEGIEIESAYLSRSLSGRSDPYYAWGPTAHHCGGGRQECVRFLSFEPETLKPKAPISLGWNSPGAAREKTSYVFEPPAR